DADDDVTRSSPYNNRPWNRRRTGCRRQEPPMTAHPLIEARTATRTRRSLQVREKARREGEERWKFALEGAGQGVWDWDIEHGRLSYSRLYAAMLGYGL